MKVSQLLGEHYKERPSECSTDSHALMIRGGYIKQLGHGIFSFYTPAKRIARKIEQILREEMDRIGAQEVQFPVVMPAAIWKASGRYDSIGDEMMRMTDRAGNDMLLGMTHEEAAVDLAGEAAKTYTKYPFAIYQIQTKFRDEPRARGGLIRVREFTMKDAYSFHTSQEDLLDFYNRCYEAYERIYRRCGIPEVVAVKSDSGMMGGSVAHEFMLLTDIGEDSIVLCSSCDYRSNMEAADSIVHNPPVQEQPMEKVHTPDAKTIEEVCAFLGVAPGQTAKAVVYQKKADAAYVVVFLRGDLEVNETKLRNYLGEEIYPAPVVEHPGLVQGFIGLAGLDKSLTTVVDRSLQGISALVCGANEADHHCKGVNLARDCGVADSDYVDVAKALEGGICPSCGKPALQVRKGIEVGNIFQLGDKYTKSMNMQYIDKDGEARHPIMGSYGIGVGRLMASVCEVHHDDYGPIWPKAIAPWQVQLCALRVDQPEVRELADKLCAQLEDAGVEVLYDDRNVSAGIIFADADLMGIPLRVIVSPKNLEQGVVELSTRDKSMKKALPVDSALAEIVALVRE